MEYTFILLVIISYFILIIPNYIESKRVLELEEISFCKNKCDYIASIVLVSIIYGVLSFSMLLILETVEQYLHGTGNEEIRVVIYAELIFVATFFITKLIIMFINRLRDRKDIKSKNPWYGKNMLFWFNIKFLVRFLTVLSAFGALYLYLKSGGEANFGWIFSGIGVAIGVVFTLEAFFTEEFIYKW